MPGVDFHFKIEGAEEMARKSKDLISKPLTEMVKKVIAFTHREIQTSTPVDTARMRSSIRGEASEFAGWVATTNVEYASFVEYGTSKMQARHVTPGTSARVFGKGPFAYGMGQLQRKIGDFLKDLGAAISARWG